MKYVRLPNRSARFNVRTCRRSDSAPGPLIKQGSHKLPCFASVILNVTEGGVKDLLYLSFHIGAKRRSAKAANR
jgi:hypothetical protein